MKTKISKDFKPHFGAPNPWRPGALAPTCPPLATPLAF